jgi:low affinity Fe/Cu permease
MYKRMMESNLPIGRTSGKTADNGRDHNGSMRERFRHFAATTATAVGSPWAFVLAVVVIIAWAVTGPIFGFSDTWQLVINTGTTIITFLMVFLIQNTQNRDARAIHLKLDELIRGLKGPRNKLVDLEDCTDEEIAQLEEEFRRFRARQRDEDRGDDDSHRRSSPRDATASR